MTSDKNGRIRTRGQGGRFERNTLNPFGINESEIATSPMVCGKCGYGVEGEFKPILKEGRCHKCGNTEGI